MSSRPIPEFQKYVLREEANVAPVTWHRILSKEDQHKENSHEFSSEACLLEMSICDSM
jgi:hypothetical protein